MILSDMFKLLTVMSFVVKVWLVEYFVVMLIVVVFVLFALSKTVKFIM